MKPDAPKNIPKEGFHCRGELEKVQKVAVIRFFTRYGELRDVLFKYKDDAAILQTIGLTEINLN